MNTRDKIQLGTKVVWGLLSVFMIVGVVAGKVTGAEHKVETAVACTIIMVVMWVLTRMFTEGFEAALDLYAALKKPTDIQK
jgi:hypothetical protein